LPKTIDFAVGTEKDDKNSKKAKKWKKKSTKKESAGTTKESAEKTKEPAGKGIIIRLYPNKSQREDLNKWFGTAKWTYNQVVALLRTLPCDLSKYDVVKKLRNNFFN
jgi:hypothetical protein